MLYAGLMLTAEGPKLVEYNSRFGDPECQVLMMRLEGDLLALMLATAKGELAGRRPPHFAQEPALTVVMAANGYPGTPAKGGAIAGLDAAEATAPRSSTPAPRSATAQLVANGGRVLDVTASGTSVARRSATAYRAVDAIDFPSGFLPPRHRLARDRAARADAGGAATLD